ncbi:NADH-dependent phenylglyoxylate dehydrogenase subunit alpha [Acetivibrio saccincola]|jgi:pyruvate ferredoxin oxidoreductase alpha subunit|uniref:NADH-dependent phenylglyoxylate dehydrogenase subunit alpha n=2 Tax=Acetivibrio saccincola TaxID=1677857 RepID=A0A2K9ELR8_9FIRM|nr:transketolase C-terminal domain-containing protein [Acetivibrio saccincola]AUG57531.1 NADH-dependent phenylglyoxylate dehydrogenase subunit alpha [Acetivibrio saccincola]
MMAKEQCVKNPEYIFFEAPREKAFITGSEAVAEAVKRANVDMAIAYPITPQSESMHLIGDLYAKGYLKDYYRAENEFAVMAAIHGASLGGGRVFTATSGPGTLRAMEMFPVWAGSRQPIVSAFMCRGVSLPPSIQPENIEMAFLLDTGMLMFHAEDAQDYFDMILKAYVIAEQPEVHLPVGVFADGFFVTHTRDLVMLPPDDIKLPEYDPKSAPVPAFDMETPPIRVTRDPLLNKSNYTSYAANATWHQEILAAAERAKKHIDRYLGGMIEVTNPNAKVLIAASGTAVSQSREAIRALEKEGIEVGLIKIKSIRPFPTQEIIKATEKADIIVVPEFNAGGWLCREIKAAIDNNSRVIEGPRVYGGMTMPKEIIMNEIKKAIGKNK